MVGAGAPVDLDRGGPADAQCPAGVEVGGACWFLGALGQSCSAVCADVALVYDEATATFAGSGGSDSNCGAVLNALSAPGNIVSQFVCDTDASIGCHVEPDNLLLRIRCTRPTLPDAFVSGTQRACACRAHPPVLTAPPLNPVFAVAALLLAAAFLRWRRSPF
jgi:hypothetical protein